MKASGGIYRSILSAVAPVAATLFLSADALAQCPLCRTALEGRHDSSARTINLAILVLLIPPVSIFCSIFAIAYKKRHGGEEEDE